MTVDKLQEALGLKILCGANVAHEEEIDGCYCGDLLSWVMSRAEAGNIWLTVMGNVNSVGVAVLAEISCIILTENAPLDDDAKKRAEENNVVILTSEHNAYTLAAEISKII
jgi:predicted transcriptional regulator